jgi:uncharacterized protein (UPF0332 family)
MSLPTDLLEQAEHLVSREKKRPKQASLRRAVSAAYYAVFHLLIDEASKLVLPANAPAGSRSRVGRTFSHAEMKRVSQAFSSPARGRTDEVSKLVQASPPVPPDLINVAKAFVDLQEARHEADYNTAIRYTRQEATTIVASARSAFEAWRRIRSYPMTRTHLIALIVWKKWDRM